MMPTNPAMLTAYVPDMSVALPPPPLILSSPTGGRNGPGAIE